MYGRRFGFRNSAIGATLILALGACGTQPGAPATPGAESPAGQDDFGPAEQSELTVGLPYPDTSFMAFMVAVEEGYFEEEGISIDDLVVVDDPRAALVSESVDVAVVDAGNAYHSAAEDLPITVIASTFCRQQFAFAAQPEVESPEDLSGEDVIISGAAGDTAELEVRKVLEEEGWSLEDVGANPVYVGYDSAAWAEFFAADRVAMTMYYSEDRATLADAGANFILNAIRPWPNELMMVRDGWLEENPNTARRFLRAMLKAVDFVTAPDFGEPPENWDRILEILEEHGFEGDVADLQELSGDERVYQLGEYNYCRNLHYDEDSWNTTIENQQLEPVPFEDGVNIEPLLDAQESLGLDNSPPAEIPWPAP